MSSQPVTFQAPVTPIIPTAWPVDDVLALFNLPFNELMFRAQTVHLSLIHI